MMKKVVWGIIFIIFCHPAVHSQEDDDIYEMLFYAISHKDDDLFARVLASEEIDIHFQAEKYNNSSLLQVASEFGNETAVRKLVESGAAIEYRNKNLLNALQIAVYSGNYQIAKLLLSLGANINSFDLWHRTPLYHATMLGDYPAILFYLKHRGNMYTSQYDGFNALHVYISDCLQKRRGINGEIIKAYLENGYNPGFEDKNKYTLMHSLAMQDDVGFFDFPIDNIHYNGKTIDGTVPLQIAIMTRSFNTAVYLLEKGADINYQDRNGESVVFWAVRTNDRNLLEILLQFNPDLSLRNHRGETVYDIASETMDLFAGNR
jgi:serine/threonine-protein phosphatase 6 regulatory ankyrin repeat subunit B